MALGEQEADKVKCGDTDFCDECDTWDRETDGVPGGPKFLTKNESGRCDYYTGPSDKIKVVDAER